MRSVLLDVLRVSGIFTVAAGCVSAAGSTSPDSPPAPPSIVIVSNGLLLGVSEQRDVEIRIFRDNGDGDIRTLGSTVADGEGFFTFDVGDIGLGGRTSIRAKVEIENGVSGFSMPWPPRIYVSNTGTDEDPGNTVSVINCLSNEVIGSIEVGDMPKGLTVGRIGGAGVNSCHNILAVANNADSTVSIVCTDTNTVIAEYPVGERPLGVYLDGNLLYVTNRGERPLVENGSLSIIDISSGESVSITLQRGTNFGIIGPAGYNILGVANMVSGTVSILRRGSTINDVQLVGSYPVSDTPSDFIMDTGLRSLVISNFGVGGSDSVRQVDLATGREIRSVFTGWGPTDIEEWGPWGIVANAYSDTVSFIDLRDFEVVRTITVTGGPDRLRIWGPHRAYVTSYFSSNGGRPGKVSVLDINRGKVVDTIEVGHYPTDISSSRRGGVALGSAVTWHPPGSGINMILEVGSYQVSHCSLRLLYVVDTESAGTADIALGVRMPDGETRWFDREFSKLVSEGSDGGIPRIVRGFRYGDLRYGILSIDFPPDIPPGYYCLVARAFLPDTDTVLQTVYSNYVNLVTGTLGEGGG